jgi:hypothetical protein
LPVKSSRKSSQDADQGPVEAHGLAVAHGGVVLATERPRDEAREGEPRHQADREGEREHRAIKKGSVKFKKPETW